MFRSKFCIVLIEEVDMILANKQKSAKDLFYNILDWTTQENSKLIAIIIANQMNLPETFLSKRFNLNLISLNFYSTFQTFNKLIFFFFFIQKEL